MRTSRMSTADRTLLSGEARAAFIKAVDGAGERVSIADGGRDSS